MNIYLALLALWHSLFFSPQMVRIPGPGGAASGGGSPFTVVQYQRSATSLGTDMLCGSTTCTLTLNSAFLAGHIGALLVYELSGSNNPLVSVTGGWTVPALGGTTFDASVGKSSAAYNFNLGTGASTVVLNFTSTATFVQVAFLELIGPTALDGTPQSVYNSSASTSYTGATVTGNSGTNDLNFQACAVSGSSPPTSADAPYDTHFANTANGPTSSATFQFFATSYIISTSSNSPAVFHGPSQKTICTAMMLK